MNRGKRKQLFADGWRPIPGGGFWLNNRGKLYDQRTEKIKTVRTVPTPHGAISTEKAVLWLFAGVNPRKGQITHLDGNKANKALDNIRYTALALSTTTVTVNLANLLAAIRCYYQIDRNAKPRSGDLLTRFYLQHIVLARSYSEAHRGEVYFALFADWLESGSTTKVAKNNQLKIKDARTIIAEYINGLTSEIVADLNAGRLSLLPFLLSKREKRQRETALLHKHGIKRPAPVQFPKTIKAGFDRLGVQPPPRPVWGIYGKLPNGAKLIVWLNRADALLENLKAAELDPEKTEQVSTLKSRIAEAIAKLNFFE